MSAVTLAWFLWAAPAAAPAPAPAPGGMSQVSELAQRAQARFETADFAGAIELWTQAYDLLPDAPEYASQRSVLAYQIASACVEAYAIDPQLAYLRKAERLYAGYLRSGESLDAETVAEVEKTLAEIRGKIREVEAATGEKDDAERERLERERAEQAAAAEKRTLAEKFAAARAAAERDARKWRKVTIAGGVTLGVGAGLLGVMGFGLARGAKVDDDGAAAMMMGADPQTFKDLLQQGTTANRLAVATGAIGGALVVTGVALVAVGVVREKRARRGVEAPLAWAPTWLPGGAGLVLAGRF